MKYFYFLLCVISISCKSINKQKPDLQKDELNGYVKKIQIVSYNGELKFGEIQKTKPLEPGITIFYDPNNIVFTSNCPEISNTINFYNSKGFKDSIYTLTYHTSKFFIQNSGFDTIKNINIRNANNLITMEYWINIPNAYNINLDTFSKKHYYYSKSQKIDSISVLSKFNKASKDYSFSHFKYKYNNEKKQKEVTYYDSDNKIDELTRVEDSVLMKKIHVYNGYGSLTSEKLIFYNANNKIIKTIEKEFGRINKEITEYRRYDKELLIGKTINITSKTKDWELQNENYESTIENSYEYKLDTFQNWIECIRKFNEVKVIQGNQYSNNGYHVIIRGIEYYK